ncbi:MAG: cytochrome c oxidase subunit II [Bacteroidetes bacterium]|nr:cytochrome c oxidase subunit II [Bacteroidota bacterium]
MFNGTSPFVDGVDNAFLFIVVISLILLVGLTFLMVYFIFRYRKERNPEASQIEGNVTLEVLWTVIPGILVLLMFWYGWKAYTPMREVPENAMVVKAVARMWAFSFEYDNGRKSDKLVVPVNKPVKVVLEAQDVLHAFYIPAFRVKQDMVPGNPQFVWFSSGKTGSYDVFCAEYCGMLHSAMITKVEVVEEADFNGWYNGETLASDEPAGLKLLKENGCISCHSTDGSALVGPSFKGLAGSQRKVTAGGKETEVTADDAYLIRAIREPSAEVAKDFPPIMQPYSLTDEQIAAITDFLKTLR